MNLAVNQKLRLFQGLWNPKLFRDIGFCGKQADNLLLIIHKASLNSGKLLRSFKLCCVLCLAVDMVDMSGQPMAVILKSINGQWPNGQQIFLNQSHPKFKRAGKKV
jgi:hypothetical protein